MPALPPIAIAPEDQAGAFFTPAGAFLAPAGHARALFARARTVAEQARRAPQTAHAARAWLRLAARRADRLRLSSLSGRITALEQGIL